MHDQKLRTLNSAQAQPALPFIHLVATGGTIAMRLDPGRGGAAPAVGGADLVAAVPDLTQMARLSVQEFSNLPSEHMTPAVWLRLARRLNQIVESGQADGIVVTHGTDTMEETAYFLDLTVPGAAPIVLTGAQRPASPPPRAEHPRPERSTERSRRRLGSKAQDEADADGPTNLRDAVRVAACPESRGRGVLIVMHGEIHAAREALKMQTEDLGAFGSHGGTDMGRVWESQIRFTGQAPPRRHFDLPEALPRVDIVPMYAGADDAALQAALQRGATGLVIAAVGAGNVNHALFEGIAAALQQGVAVVIATRVPHGLVRPLYAYAGGGVALQKAGAILAGDLTPQKARVMLMLALAAGKRAEALQECFERPECGIIG